MITDLPFQLPVTIGFDATWADMSSLPLGAQWAGYSTGTGIVPWPRAWLDAHPGVLRICQDPDLTDDTADYGDIEWQAGLVDQAPGFITRARAAWHAAKRPGQRWPGLYVNGSNLHPVANALVAARIPPPVPVILADWNLSQAAATADVLAAIAMLASGTPDPFPIVGIQFTDPGPYDIDVYSSAWLANVSRKPVPQPPRLISDGILVSKVMGWTGHRMRSGDHGETWTEINE